MKRYWNVTIQGVSTTVYKKTKGAAVREAFKILSKTNKLKPLVTEDGWFKDVTVELNHE